VLLAGRADGDLNVLAKLGQELHQPLDREHPGPVAHQGRDMRLLDTKDLAGLRLRESARLDDLVDLERQPRLQQVLLSMGQVISGPRIRIVDYRDADGISGTSAARTI
jgi:hypothetical protein